MSPMAPRRPCLTPRCPGFATPGRSYCPEHQRASWRQQNARRPAELRAFYDSAAWRQLRAAHLELYPGCEDCSDKGRATPAAQVDHIVPLREAPDRALDPTNLRSLCKSCHSAKTLTERHRAARGER